MNAGIRFLALAGASILLTSGCQSMRAMDPDPAPTAGATKVFNYDGIPLKQYYVGGGYAVRYIARQDGTLFMADDTAKRLLETISLHAGEKYETKYPMDDAKTVIKLYFVPATEF